MTSGTICCHRKLPNKHWRTKKSIQQLLAMRHPRISWMQQFVRSKTKKLFLSPHQEKMPLAVVGSNVVIEVNGKKVRGRQYPWGVAEGRFTQVHDQKRRTRLPFCGQTKKMNQKSSVHTLKVHKGQWLSMFCLLSVDLIHSMSLCLGQTMADVREANACWRLEVDVFGSIQQSQYYYLYHDEQSMILLSVGHSLYECINYQVITTACQNVFLTGNKLMNKCNLLK